MQVDAASVIVFKQTEDVIFHVTITDNKKLPLGLFFKDATHVQSQLRLKQNVNIEDGDTSPIYGVCIDVFRHDVINQIPGNQRYDRRFDIRF